MSANLLISIPAQTQELRLPIDCLSTAALAFIRMRYIEGNVLHSGSVCMNDFSKL